MKSPSFPENERARKSSLDSYRILDTNSEQIFDDLAQLASNLFETPMSLINLVDTHRQWFKAKKGIELSETPREIAFCAHTILQDEPLIVGDALEDEKFKDNPFVVSEPNIRFYAGAPLVNYDGFKLGTICVLDTKPRSMEPIQIENLKLLAKQAIYLMEVNKQNAEHNEFERQLNSMKYYMESIVNKSPELTYVIDLESHATRYANGCILDLLDYPEEEVLQYNNNYFMRIVHPDDYLKFTDHYNSFKLLNDEDVIELPYRAKHYDGSWHWMLCRERIFERNQQDQPTQIIGIVRDISEEIAKYAALA